MKSICSALRSLTRNPVQNRSSPRYCKADKVPACGICKPQESLEQIVLNALRIQNDPFGKTGWRMKPSQDTCCRCSQDTMFGGNIGDVMDLRGHCRIMRRNAPFFCFHHIRVKNPNDTCTATSVFLPFTIVSSVKNSRFLTC